MQTKTEWTQKRGEFSNLIQLTSELFRVVCAFSDYFSSMAGVVPWNQPEWYTRLTWLFQLTPLTNFRENVLRGTYTFQHTTITD